VQRSGDAGCGRGELLLCMFVCSFACWIVPTARRHAHIRLRFHVGALRQQRPDHLSVAIGRRSVERRPSILRRTQASRSAPSLRTACICTQRASQPATVTVSLISRAQQSSMRLSALLSIECIILSMRAASQPKKLPSSQLPPQGRRPSSWAYQIGDGKGSGP
jgi:hypothetical protein